MTTKASSFMKRFFELDSAGGILLILASILAIVLANSPLSSYYKLLLTIPLEIRVGAIEVAKPLLLWINDGLMAIFFFLVGLELKRELTEGELSSVRDVVLPGLGAIGGVVVPALIYLYFNQHDPVAVRGWAIPAATDIAFALGVMSLLGSRVPISMKLFLTSLAIFDDIGAIIIIAIFYTSSISINALIVVAACIPVLLYLNRTNVVAKLPYVVIGIIMWIATLKSGVHATLAGVVLAMFIPMRSKENPAYSPVRSMEHDLHSMVAFVVLPLFAFANSGIDLRGMSMDQLMHGVPVGIALGLFFGKQIGVFLFCYIGILLRAVRLPKGMSLLSLYGVSILCGIGFTMSLFIGSLAFVESGKDFDERIGIILGSVASGIMGYLVLRFSLKRDRMQNDLQKNEETQ